VDPIDGNDKKLEHYWKAVAAKFNSNIHQATTKEQLCNASHIGKVSRRRLQNSVGSILRLQELGGVESLMI
jgi:hypothetical protein